MTAPDLPPLLPMPPALLPQGLQDPTPQDPTLQPAKTQRPRMSPESEAAFEAIQQDAAKRRAVKQQELLGTFRAAVQADPALEAKKVEIARKLRIPVDQLGTDAADLQVAEEAARMAELRQFHANNPELDSFLSNLQTVRRLHDDLGNLQKTTGIFDWWRRNYEAGTAVNEGGYLKAKGAFVSLTAGEQDRLAELKNIETMAGLESTGPFDEFAGLAGQMVEPMLKSAAIGGGMALVTAPTGPGALASFKIGFVSSLFAQTAITEFGHEYEATYEQLIAAGVPPAEARIAARQTASAYAVGAATVETFADVLLGAPWFKAAKQGGTRLAGKVLGEKILGQAGLKTVAGEARRQFLRDTLLGFGAEVGQEGVQEAMGAISENVAADITGTKTGPTTGESLERIGEVMWKMSKGMAVLAPIGPALHYAADLDKVKKSKIATETFTKLAEAAKESEVNKRSPDTYAAMVTAAAGASGPQNVYIEGPKLAQALEQTGYTREKLAQVLPDAAEQLKEAERTGDDVVIKIGDFAAHVAPSDLYPAVQKSLRLEKDGYSQDRADEWLAEKEANQKETEKLVAEQSVKFVNWHKEAEAVEARMLTELQKDARIPAARARATAMLHRNFVEATAARVGMTPAEFDAAHRLTFQVQREKRGQGTLEQFAGPNAKTADLSQLSMAREMLKSGADPDEVRRTTGWFKGLDGKFRFEISDEAASLRAPVSAVHSLADADRLLTSGEMKTQRLGDVLKHDRLFAAYPELAGVEFFSYLADVSNRGLSTPRGKRTLLGINAASPAETHLSTILHELQHMVQGLEGFAQGGSWQMFSYKDMVALENEKAEKVLARFKKENPEAVDRYEAFVRAREVFTRIDMEGKLFDPKAVEAMKKTDEAFGALLDSRGGSELWNKLHPEPFEAYERLAGEVEARMVERRRKDNDFQRRYRNPVREAMQMEGREAEDVIVTFNGKEFSLRPDNAGDLLEQPVIFYSALRRAIDGLNVKALTEDQWLQQLKALQNKGAIKEQEVFWTGLKEFLEIAGAPRPAIYDIVYGADSSPAPRAAKAKLDEGYGWQVFDQDGKYLTWVRNPDFTAAQALAETQARIESGAIPTSTFPEGELIARYDTEEQARERLALDEKDRADFPGMRPTKLQITPATEARKITKEEVLAYLDKNGVQVERRTSEEQQSTEERWSVVNSSDGSVEDTFESEGEAQDRADELNDEYIDEQIKEVVSVEEATDTQERPGIEVHQNLAKRDTFKRIEEAFPNIDEPFDSTREAENYAQEVFEWAKEEGLLEPESEFDEFFTVSDREFEIDSYIAVYSGSSRSQRQLERSLPDELLWVATEEEADANAEKIRDWVRDNSMDQFYDDLPYYVGEDETQGDGETKFEGFTMPGPKSDYTEVALVLTGLRGSSKTLHEVPSAHSFGGEETDENRIAHLRYSQRPVFVFNEDRQKLAAQRDELTKQINKLLDEAAAKGREAVRVDTGTEEGAIEFRRLQAEQDQIVRHREVVFENRDKVIEQLNQLDAGHRVNTLFIDEIQSDWADDGQEDLFHALTTEEQQKRDVKRSLAEAHVKLAEDNLEKFTKENIDKLDSEDPETTAKRRELLVELGLAYDAQKKTKKPQVSPAPFVMSTDAWAMLTVKQAFVEAAQKGVPFVSVINGIQASKVYASTLAKKVESIKWQFRSDPTVEDTAGERFVKRSSKQVSILAVGGDRFGVTVNRAGRVVGVSGYQLEPAMGKPLSAVLGKDMAEKVLADWTFIGGAGELTPEEFSVGGEGMRAFYGDEHGHQTTAGDKTKFDPKSGKPVTAIIPKLMREIAGKLGIEPSKVTISGHEGEENFTVRLDEEARKKILEGFPLFQTKDDEARGAFDPISNQAFLYEKADPSTVFHEMSHYWLTSTFKAADSPTASVQLRTDVQTLLDWFGVKNLEAWNALSLEQQRKHHETFAFNAEIYLSEGKAPGVDEPTVRMFRAVGRWIRLVYREIRDKLNPLYKSLFGVDLPVLTPEVRAVYDRMLAAEDAIEAAEAQRAMAPMFRDRPEGMSDLDWAEMKLAQEDGREKAVVGLQNASLKALAWMGRATRGLFRMVNKQAQKIRKGVEAEELAAAQQEPVYVARRAIGRGESVEPDGSVVPVQIPKLHDATVAKMLVDLGEDIDALKGLTSPDGDRDIDTIAELMGFATGESMVRALATAPPLEEEVGRRTDQRMLTEHSDLTDPEKIEQKVEAVLHNEAREKMVTAELRFMGKVQATTRVMMRAARTQARENIGKKRIGDVRPSVHTQAETRARREAERFWKKGDVAQAVGQKRRELLEGMQAREAANVREEISTAQALFKKLFKSDEKLAKTRNVDYVAIARGLVAAFGLQPGEKLAETYTAQLQAYNPELFEKLEPILARATQWAEEARQQGRVVKDWRDLTVDEFRDLSETVAALWHQSRREQQFEVEGKKVDLNGVAEKVVAQNDKLPPGPTPPPGTETSGEAGRRTFRSLLFLAVRPENWCWRKDGAERVGAFTRYFWRPVRAAVERYVTDRNHYTKRVANLVRELRPKLKLGKIEFRDAQGKLLHVFGRGNGGFGQAELIAALLHIGNPSNLERLLTGRGWGTYNRETDTLDTAAWDAFLAKMVKDGVVTKDVMDFVQAVWDLNEEIKPIAQRAHRDLFGFYFKEIEVEPVVMPWGTYRGGYMPAKLDKTARSATKIAGLKELEADYRKQFATTGRGFTRKRADHFGEALLLDLDLVPQHIDDVLRFSHIQPAVRDVERLAKHDAVFAALEASQPGVWDKFLLPWLQRTASQSTTKAGMHEGMDNFWRFVRSGAGLSLMFANIANTLQQLTGLISASLRMKPRYLFHGMWRLINDRGDLFKEIAEASPGFMGNRQHSQVFDSVDAINSLMQNKSKFAKARAWSKRHAYFMQTTMQNLVDAIVWSGAFKQATDNATRGQTDEQVKAEAIKQADAAVRATQGSFEATDVAGYEVGTPFYKTFTQFGGFFNAMANLQADQFARMAGKGGFAKAGVAFQMYLVGFAVPMLLADAISRTLRGQWEDDDEDGEVDVFTLDYLFLGQLRAALAEIPVIGPNALTPMLSWLDDEKWNDRMTTSPAVTLLEREFKGTFEAFQTALGLKKDRKGNVKSIEGKNIRDVMTMLGIAFGLPAGTVGKYGGYVRDVATGETELTARGALTGQAAPKKP